MTCGEELRIHKGWYASGPTRVALSLEVIVISRPINQDRRVAVVGVGYIGYPLALLMAFNGLQVLAVDTDERVVESIKAGRVLSEEPAVMDLARDPLVRANLSAGTSPIDCSVFVIAVPTPLLEGSRTANLAAVEAAARSIVPDLKTGDLVIVESTVPPGTTSGLVASILRESRLEVGTEVFLAHCPERLHPGSTLEELARNDRVIGGFNEASTHAARELYSAFVDGALIETDSITAELCKLFENTYRDVNLALANQMAEISESFAVDALAVLAMASRHPRVSYLSPSIGVGGQCVPIDPWFLHQVAPESSQLIETAREVNLRREVTTAERIIEELETLGGSVVVLAGIAYKPNVPDTRESPAMRIVQLLKAHGLEVRVHDPVAYPDGGDLISLVHGADLLAVLVPHRKMVESISGSIDEVRDVMRNPMVRDYSTGMSRPFVG